MENWKWTNPFAADDFSARFDASCTSKKTFPAREFLLDDLSVPPPVGLAPYMDALKKLFADRPYPGSWDGIDPHGYDRNLLQMKYVDVPVAVREWIEEQDRSKGEGQGFFAVYRVPEVGTKAADTVAVGDPSLSAEERAADDETKTVIFAPGAVYQNLPLWVAEGSDCVGRSPWLRLFSGAVG
ncbi:hypothetical protein QBC39DRAFT_349986 [Podospora conica]|nr:hypothetical protein QBC39DRAFT_349986 [Schizothecium conicum]